MFGNHFCIAQQDRILFFPGPGIGWEWPDGNRWRVEWPITPGGLVVAKVKILCNGTLVSTGRFYRRLLGRMRYDLADAAARSQIFASGWCQITYATNAGQRLCKVISRSGLTESSRVIIYTQRNADTLPLLVALVIAGWGIV